MREKISLNIKNFCFKNIFCNLIQLLVVPIAIVSINFWFSADPFFSIDTN